MIICEISIRPDKIQAILLCNSDQRSEISHAYPQEILETNFREFKSLVFFMLGIYILLLFLHFRQPCFTSASNFYLLIHTVLQVSSLTLQLTPYCYNSIKIDYYASVHPAKMYKDD